MANKPQKVSDGEFDTFLFNLFMEHLYVFSTIDLVLVQEAIQRDGWKATKQEIIAALNRFLHDPKRGKHFYVAYLIDEQNAERCPARLCFRKD